MAPEMWDTSRATHLEQMLQTGERPLWQGKPVRRNFIRRHWFMSCFGAVFLGFALFWTAMALTLTSLVPSGFLPYHTRRRARDKTYIGLTLLAGFSLQGVSE